MPISPPTDIIEFSHHTLGELLETNPLATCSEAYLQNHYEFTLLQHSNTLNYFLRIGINYHGKKVQHIMIDNTTNTLVGWNPAGNALGTGDNAKLLLANHTIFNRDPDEQLMSDSKIAGGNLPTNSYLRIEFKVRGWIGKTKNLDGKQLEKDLDLLKSDKADLLILCLSETAHSKFRGEGDEYQASRRSGTNRLSQLLFPLSTYMLSRTLYESDVNFEGQDWHISSQKICANNNSFMPGSIHTITLIWRNN